MNRWGERKKNAKSGSCDTLYLTHFLFLDKGNLQHNESILYWVCTTEQEVDSREQVLIGRTKTASLCLFI